MASGLLHGTGCVKWGERDLGYLPYEVEVDFAGDGDGVVACGVGDVAVGVVGFAAFVVGEAGVPLTGEGDAVEHERGLFLGIWECESVVFSLEGDL